MFSAQSFGADNDHALAARSRTAARDANDPVAGVLPAGSIRPSVESNVFITVR